MKSFLLFGALGILLNFNSNAQTVSVEVKNNKKNSADTVRVGLITVIYSKKGDSTKSKTASISCCKPAPKKQSKINTNWWVLDLGFANYKDNSNYRNAAFSGFVAPNVKEDQLKLKTSHSVNVNLWIVTQTMDLYKRKWNLKYALGLEMNNYQFRDETLHFTANPTYIQLGDIVIPKAKLAADYLTVPLMINYNTTPGKRKGLSLSAGVSAGFLYSARFKTRINSDVDKIHNDFDLEKFKLAYVGEIGIRKIKLYGSVGMKNMWAKGLDMTPVNIGFRLGNW
jgi:hypothetical protein